MKLTHKYGINTQKEISEIYNVDLCHIKTHILRDIKFCYFISKFDEKNKYMSLN
jgi:hypothetical protein